MSNSTQVAAVDFHGHTLTAITANDQQLVAMRPICESIGLDWKAQYDRIKRDEVLASTMVITTTVAQDGKQRQIACLPLDMLNGWLFGVEVKRCRREIQPALILFKRECYAALAAYWKKPTDSAPAPRQPAVIVQADEDVIHLHYNRRPLLVYRQGQNFWYRSAHVAALVGGRDSHVVTRSLPPEDTISLQTGNQHVGMLSHRALLASLGRLKREDAEALLAWLQLVIPGAFTPMPAAEPAQLNPEDAGSLLRAMLAGTRFLCHLDDMGRVSLREIPSDHMIISAERLPSYIADPCGPKRQLLPAILQAVSKRMERVA